MQDSGKRHKQEDSESEDGGTIPESRILNPDLSKEKGGPKGPDPVRYGDWEIGGKCVDF